MDKTALGKVFLDVILFYPVSFIPPMLHIHIRLNIALNQTDKREKPGKIQTMPYA